MKINRRKMAAGVPAVAMADIAFNLVLFFICTAVAKTQDDSQFALVGRQHADRAEGADRESQHRHR